MTMHFNPKKQSSIITGIRKRDDKAYKFLKEKLFGRVTKMVLERQGTEDDAQDVFSEGFLQLTHHLDNSENSPPRDVAGYLFVICRNIWQKTLERRKQDKDYREYNHGDKIDHGIEWYVEKNVKKKVFWESYNKLREKCQKVLFDKYSGVPSQKLAAELNITPNHLYKMVHECYKQLLANVNAHPLFDQVND